MYAYISEKGHKTEKGTAFGKAEEGWTGEDGKSIGDCIEKVGVQTNKAAQE